MPGIGERAQIHADFGNDGPGRFAVDSRYPGRALSCRLANGAVSDQPSAVSELADS